MADEGNGTSNTRLLEMLVHETRQLRALYEQQAMFTASSARAQYHMSLLERFKDMLPPTNGVGGAPDLAFFWTSMRGDAGWRDHLSGDQLSALLSTDERVQYTLSTLSDAVPSGFAEQVLSRLPRLERCTLKGTRHPARFSALQHVANPFPVLQTLDMRGVPCDDEELLHAVRLMPSLRTLDVTGCAGITDEGIAAASAARPGIEITPRTSEARQLAEQQIDEDAKFLDFESAESNEEYERLWALYGEVLGDVKAPCADGPLLTLWHALGGTCHWQNTLRPSQLSLLLSRMETGECNVGTKERRFRAVRLPALTLVPAEELVGFVSQVLSRLPHLQTLRVWDAHVWPVDWASIDGGVWRPFPVLWYVHIRFTPYCVGDLVEFVRHVTTVVGHEVHVDLSRLGPVNQIDVQQQCMQRISFD